MAACKRTGVGGVACQDAATSALQIAQSASRPHAQRLKHGMQISKLCLQTRNMPDSFRQTQQVSQKHTSVTHNITRKHQIMSICTETCNKQNLTIKHIKQQCETMQTGIMVQGCFTRHQHAFYSERWEGKEGTWENSGKAYESRESRQLT